jgi:predicted Rossmann-fold nucleotide-binding protein
MGAVAEGARAAGAETVGLPMAGGSHPQPDPAHVIWHRSYGDRLDHRASMDAVVALWGGVGTLSEWTLAWASHQTEGRPRTIVLVGLEWERVLASLEKSLIASPDDFVMVKVITGVDEVPGAILAAIRC